MKKKIKKIYIYKNINKKISFIRRHVNAAC